MYARKSLTKKTNTSKVFVFFVGLFMNNVYSKKTVRPTKRKFVLNDRFLTSALPIQRQTTSDFIDTLFLAF